MRSQEELNRKMSEISQPVEAETDPFVNLFEERQAAEKPVQRRVVRRPLKKAPRKPGRQSMLSRRLAALHGGGEKKKPSAGMPPEQRGKVQNRPEGVSVYLWLPIAGVALFGIFSVGYFGGNMAGGNLAVSDRVRGGETLAAIDVPVSPKPVTGTLAMAPAIPQKQPATTVIPQKRLASITTVQQPVMAKPLDPKERVARLLRDGHRLELISDFSAARVKFRQAYAAGASAAALAMARTYDRRSWKKGTTLVKAGDAGKAREWYEKWFLTALERGEISPRARYDRLLKGLNKS
ncbi:MAG TPA: hypothetical protein ENJ55_04665 [Rhizobiales bacterium]|nr:hypothetical protein [Hyphomicrobiales bacterium]